MRDEEKFEEEFNEREPIEEKWPDYTQETAAEVASPGVGSRENISEPEREETEQRTTMESNVNNDSLGKGIGITSIVLAICSLFFLPVVLGGLAILGGFFARAQGASTSGYWAMGIGAFSIIVALFFGPFM